MRPASPLGRRVGGVALALLSTVSLGAIQCGGGGSGTGFDAGGRGDGGAEGTVADAKVREEQDGHGPNLIGETGGKDVPGPPVDKCHVPTGTSSGNAPTCKAPPAPPNSFDPATKWTWTEPAAQAAGAMWTGSMVMPLVAEMVDTNGDGSVDLCDIPSVIVTVNGGPPHAAGYIFMLSGDKGEVQALFDGQVDASVTPALGDIDGDGLAEVIANDPSGHLVAYDHAGHVKWTSPQVLEYYADLYQYCGAIAIYDLDGDGNPEIIDGFEVLDNKGNHLWSVNETMYDGQFYCPAVTAADLDGDGRPELIVGNGAYHHDGTAYWTIAGPPGQPQVADFDGSGSPQIFVARQDGVMLLAHDGTQLIAPTQSFDPASGFTCWSKAGAVGDFDGTGHASIMDGSCAHFGIWHVGSSAFTLLWNEPIADPSGIASSTAFDLLGRGIADAVYGDEAHLWVYDGENGSLELQGDRSSGTLIEYPVIADVDNDGSADIVVVSNTGGSSGGVYSNTVQVFQEAMKRWAPTRRIWNQHAYHVTNVNEDGTIPKTMAPSWKYLNTFRMNAQIEGNMNCAPPPANPK